MLLKLSGLALLPFVFAFVALMRLLAPWKLIRIGELWNGRLGHLIGNTECYLCEIDAGMHPKSLDLWFCRESRDCNTLIGVKYRKLLHIVPRRFGRLVAFVNRMFHGWEVHCCESPVLNRDIHNLWKGSHISFTKKEEARGLELLRDLGIPEGSKWVCLIVRDSSYLKSTFPETDWSYHDYRDADVENYLLAAKALAKRGYYVIRMGAIVSKPFYDGEKIIDYANSTHRSEFGDLYLGAKCEFCIGTPTGFIAIPQSFGRPMVVTDMVSIEYLETFFPSLAIWKHHIKDEREMSAKEIIDCGAGLFQFSSQFEKAGIKLSDNTPEEIMSVAIEMSDQGIDNEPQAFWQTFPNSVEPYSNQLLHGKVKMRIGREFLKGYTE